MIVIDSSAVIAILKGEAEAEALGDIMARATRSTISAFNVLELRTVVLKHMGPPAVGRVDAWLEGHEVQITSFDAEQAAVASEAYARFGKGRHPARLNLGDCAAYALARTLDAPLLYKGEDFARTDIRAAI